MTASDNNTPPVVIVTPVFNGASFLAEAMDSVQAQSYRNLVHVVLDNASTDATPAILEAYRSAPVPVRLVRNDRTLSMGDNWNAALELVPADAAYFRILCADDVMGPEFVASTVDLAERNSGVIAVGCGLHHRGELLSGGWEADREVFGGQETAQRFFTGEGVIIAHQVLFRRRALDLRRPFLDPLMAANDTDALLDLMRHGDWGFVHQNLAVTRDHDGADTVTTVRRYRLDLCEHLILLERHAEFAFGRKAGWDLVRRYRRYYLRQLIKWRMRGEHEVFARHMRALGDLLAADVGPSIVDAALDWPLIQAGLRKPWEGYPFSASATGPGP